MSRLFSCFKYWRRVNQLSLTQTSETNQLNFPLSLLFSLLLLGRHQGWLTYLYLSTTLEVKANPTPNSSLEELSHQIRYLSSDACQQTLKPKHTFWKCLLTRHLNPTGAWGFISEDTCVPSCWIFPDRLKSQHHRDPWAYLVSQSPA